jgi:peptide/nickel transport system ATP-binding protein
LQLKQQFGISLVYITHDLATAYQISDRIVVLHRGAVVEAGDPEQVVKHPEHPYTKLLIGSIPMPDPSQGWGDGAANDGGAADRPVIVDNADLADRDGHEGR